MPRQTLTPPNIPEGVALRLALPKMHFFVRSSYLRALVLIPRIPPSNPDFSTQLTAEPPQRKSHPRKNLTLPSRLLNIKAAQFPQPAKCDAQRGGRRLSAIGYQPIKNHRATSVEIPSG
jgi:hypothetical protein